MKKLSSFILTFILLLSFIGCQSEDSISDNKVTQEPTVASIEDSHETTESKFSSTSYNLGCGIIGNIPSDRYEEYPNRHNVPLSATLYKNSEAILIDVNDSRLIRLINLFNNALYCDDCVYIQSFLSDEYLEENVINEEFRLELKYEPYGDERPSPYENEPTQFDTIIITGNYFVLINHDYPMTSWNSETEYYSVLAAGYCPYDWQGSWLDLFGF